MKDFQPVKWHNRLLHFIIDWYLVGIILTIFGGFDFDSLNSFYSEDEIWGMQIQLVFIFLFIYWVILESIFGLTIGKLFTGSRVVNLEGGKPRFSQALRRAVIRMFPFEMFSYFSQRPIPWHDRWTKTRVVNKSELFINKFEDVSEI